MASDGAVGGLNVAMLLGACAGGAILVWAGYRLLSRRARQREGAPPAAARPAGRAAAKAERRQEREAFIGDARGGHGAVAADEGQGEIPLTPRGAAAATASLCSALATSPAVVGTPDAADAAAVRAWV